MIFTNLNLYYIRMLSCKFQLFYPSSSWEDFWMNQPNFYIFVIISPLKRTWPFIWIKSNFLYPRIIPTVFDWIWSSGSGEEDNFLKYFRVLLLFCYYLPLERGNTLHLNKLESPPPKDDLYQVWIKLAQYFLRRFLNDHAPFLHFCDYLHFKEDLALYLNKLEFPLPEDNLYQVWLNLAMRFWRKRFLKYFSVILLFRYYLPLEKSNPLHLNKLESPSPKANIFLLVGLRIRRP
jgi:hypothetical protein